MDCALCCVFSVHNNIVFYALKSISDYKYDISGRYYDSESAWTAAARPFVNFHVPLASAMSADQHPQAKSVHNNIVFTLRYTNHGY